VQNMHTPADVVCLRAIRRVSRLLATFISRLDESFIAKLTYELPAADEKTTADAA